ncbi:hypothetical protein [Pararobbsia alpina]|uniref:tRNA nuclease CdiA C-terminal domain-containing protein n=1 Tax=Pararobbsia alpina TaxID=621374 RepID=A0A6S7B2V2_9BURK|nr:hypothetical protein [Pararobbsia alpina]CAB3783736.1 hypothetical protein LMG28138_01699 [Pararobbsia alpina]
MDGVTGAAGAAAALGAGCSTIVVCGFAATVATTSLDYSKAGFQQLIHGEQMPTYGEQMLRGLGMSPNGAAMAYGAANLGSTLGRTAIGLPRVNQAVGAPAIQHADTSTSAGNLTITAGKFSPHERSMARHLASQGYRVVLRSPVGRRIEGKTSDLLVNGVPYDVYTPQTASVHRIVGAIADKNSQAQGIVLDLSETSVTREQLGNLLQRVRGTGATNIQDIKIIGKQDAEHQMRMRP